MENIKREQGKNEQNASLRHSGSLPFKRLTTTGRVRRDYHSCDALLYMDALSLQLCYFSCVLKKRELYTQLY